MRRQTRLLASLLLAGLATACGSSTPLLEESLDYGTGITFTRATAPIVLYHDNSGHAAYARDYVYVGPIEVNRMGSYSYYLWLGIWSTLDDASRWTQRDGFESVVLYADGEPLQLEVAGGLRGVDDRVRLPVDRRLCVVTRRVSSQRCHRHTSQ